MPQQGHIVPDGDPREAAGRLCSLSDPEKVRSVMNALEPEAAARLVAHAPGIEAQTRLVWSLAKSARAAVLDHLPAVAVASLIQNQERRNRRLLGDISLDQFAEIVRFCQPKQRYYWLTLANSFADMGANLLVLLLPPLEVAEALVTVPEFRRSLPALRRYITCLGPGGFDTDPPVRDKKLKAVLIRLATYDLHRFREVVETAMRLPAEEARLPAPELPRVPELPPLTPRQAPPAGDAGDGLPEEAPPLLPMLLDLPGDSLMRRAAAALAPACRQALQHDMQRMLRQEAMAEGGSLAQHDLERVATRIQAYVRLGLQGVPEEPSAVAEVLRDVPFGDIVEHGAIALEQLRQVAFKLRPFTAVLDAGQRMLLEDLYDLRATMHPETSVPALLIRSAGRRGSLPVPVTAVQERLADISLWVAVSRSLGIRALSENLAARTNGSLGVLAALGVSLLRHGKWDPQVLEADALREFRGRHYNAGQKGWLPGTPERLHDALDAWMEHARLGAEMRPRFRARVLEAMAHLERFLKRTAAPTWDRFAPGERR